MKQSCQIMQESMVVVLPSIKSVEKVRPVKVTIHNQKVLLPRR